MRIILKTYLPLGTYISEFKLNWVFIERILLIVYLIVIKIFWVKKDWDGIIFKQNVKINN